MANKVRVRVEAKRLPMNASRQERDIHIQRLLRVLKRACNEYGVQQSLKEHEFYQRPCDIRRRKKALRLMAARQEFTEKETEGYEQLPRN